MLPVLGDGCHKLLTAEQSPGFMDDFPRQEDRRFFLREWRVRQGCQFTHKSGKPEKVMCIKGHGVFLLHRKCLPTPCGVAWKNTYPMQFEMAESFSFQPSVVGRILKSARY